MNNLQGNFGNINYKAPEMLLNLPYNGIKADVFSLGQILFNIVTGINGFNSARHNDNYYRLIFQQDFEHYWQRIENTYHLNLSQNFKNLFITMVSYDPAHRPTIFDDILNHPWFQEINVLNEGQRNTLENEVRNEFQIRQQHIQPIQQVDDLNDDN